MNNIERWFFLKILKNIHTDTTKANSRDTSIIK